MEAYEAGATIEASAERAWAVLLDGDRYPSWGSGIERIEGRVADGEKIKVVSKLVPGRAFPVRVAIDDAGRKMTWTGGMPLGLFRGVRTFRLSDAGGGAVRFSMREEFTGPLLRMIWKKMPDLGPSFDQFAAGLKAEAEAGSPQR